MKIKKVLNNNAVISHNEKGEEIVILGSGIAFRKKSGDQIILRDVDKVFYLKKSSNRNKFYELISSIPIKYIKITEKIIKNAENKLGMTLDENLYLLLTDHIHYAVERSKDGKHIRNKMIWEIEHYYPLEYKIGIESVDMINETLGCNLMKQEAGFIAMHIVNASSCNNIEEFQEEVKDIKAIMKIVTYHFDTKINEESVNYLRFITHLKYFIQRIRSGEVLNKIEQSDELFSLVCQRYFQAYLCVEKIEKYFLKTYQIEISDEEKMYLVLHIERVISNT